VCAAALAAQTPQAPPSPSPQPSGRPPITFGVDVTYVEIDAIVTDAKGNPVRDLKPEDFVVLEDGKPQKVELFSLIDVPYEQPETEPKAPPLEPDVRTNERAFEGRVYLIVLDELHTAALRSNLVKQAMRRFFERHFGENDLAAIVYTTGRADASQDLTSNRRLLLASVDKFMGRRLRSATLNKIDDYLRNRDTPQQNDPARDFDEMERGHNARVTLDVLRQAADWMSALRGRRKALIFVSEGIDYDYTNFNNRDGSTILEGLREAISTSERANTSIYAVDPRGLHTMSDEMMEMQVVQDTSLGLDSRGLYSEMRLAQDSLRTLAEETRGLAIVSTNDFSKGFQNIVKDNSSYYLLGYYPANQKRDERWRKLQVKVPARPGVKVRARGGYSLRRARTQELRPVWAQRDTPTPLVEMLKSPLPKSGLTLAVNAVPFKDKGPDASVLVTVQTPGGAFKLVQAGQQWNDTLELSVVATTPKGRTKGNDNKIELNLRERNRRIADALGFRVLQTLLLPPGQYQLRVAGRAVNSDTTGSVFYDFEVPDFAKAPLDMSGVLLSSAMAGILPTAGTYEPLKGVLPAPPTTWRDFNALDTLAVVAEVYDNESRLAHTVDILTAVKDEAGVQVFNRAEERSTSELTEGGAIAFVHKTLVPLKDMAPGLYTLRVEARSRLGKQPSVAREVRFRVWPAPERQPSGE
jgi:VWFA-related protein